jgi:hypothetical protein
MKEAVVNHQLQKIEKLAEEKADELEDQQFDKYHEIYDLAFKFLSTLPVLLYGGMAINDLLPSKMKIYKKHKLPDIDIFTKDSIKIAKGLVAYFKKHGHQVASYGDALHEGTYKVYVMGLQVVDISEVSPKAFKRLSENSFRGESGLMIVNPQFLRMSLHMMLSQPNDAHRWTKVFQRLIALYKVIPPIPCKKSVSAAATLKEDEIANIIEINKLAYDYVISAGYMLFGLHELEIFFETIPDHFRWAPDLPAIQVLTTNDVFEVATDIIEKLGYSHLTLTPVYEADDFIPRHIFITYGRHKLMGIFTANSCMSYIDYKGMKVASIHTVIRMYMLMLLSGYSHFERIYDSLECMVNALSSLQFESIGSKKKIFKEFIKECYGMHKGLITLKRERLLRYEK